MSKSVLQDKFNMEKYIEKRMLEITNPEERKLYKEVAGRMMLELHNHNKEALERLEIQVFEETKQVDSSFFVTMGMTDQAHYDSTDTVFSPIFEEDVSHREISAQDVLKTLEKKQDYLLYHIYLEESYPVVNQFCVTERRFHGVIKTPKGDYKATFRVEKNEDYKEKLVGLYKSFIGSNISWSTLCNAHLNKRVNVFLCSAENIKNIEEITEVQVDFEEYASSVRYHTIPIWNLELIEEKSSTYPVPCEDKINYEHRIYAHRLNENCQYLVAGETEKITHVYRLKGDLIIVAPQPMPHNWKLYKFNDSTKLDNSGYPLLSNKRKQSFTHDLTGMFHKQIRTKAGIGAIIRGFSYESRIIYKGMELCSRPKKRLTYDMDDFLSEEIACGVNREALCLHFQAENPEYYLNYDIMSFLVTQVQAAIPDYDCFGKLV